MTLIGDLLGGKDVFAGTIANDFELAHAVRIGFPAIVVSKAIKSLELTREELESIIPRRTLDRRLKKEQRLTLEESDRLARVVRIAALAIDVFDDRQKALAWMRRPNRALGGTSPIEISITNPGARLAENILGRMAHGVFS